jgi:hypothetical protein
MRFTIRDLLWLTVVVALGVAWWVDRQAVTARERLWREGVVNMVAELERTTGFKARFTTPEGDLIDPLAGKLLDSDRILEEPPR